MHHPMFPQAKRWVSDFLDPERKTYAQRRDALRLQLEIMGVKKVAEFSTAEQFECLWKFIIANVKRDGAGLSV